MHENIPACIAWLQQLLSSGPAEFDDILDNASKHGFSQSLLTAAGDALDMVEYRKDGNVWWKLQDSNDGGEE